MSDAVPPGFRYFHVIGMVFVACLIISNTIAVKLITWHDFTLPAGIIVFPLSYIFADVLTEVYGYRKARKIIWSGFACMGLAAGFYWWATVLSPAAFWSDQEAFSRLFGFVPRIALSSFLAYLVGEFLNAAVLSKMKTATKGRYFGLRAIGSTLVGQGADSLVFNFAAFLGVFAFKEVAFIALSGWVLKCLYEVVALPITYPLVAWLKRAEGIDTYDVDISYSPFARGD